MQGAGAPSGCYLTAKKAGGRPRGNEPGVLAPPATPRQVQPGEGSETSSAPPPAPGAGGETPGVTCPGETPGRGALFSRADPFCPNAPWAPCRWCGALKPPRCPKQPTARGRAVGPPCGSTPSGAIVPLPQPLGDPLTRRCCPRAPGAAQPLLRGTRASSDPSPRPALLPAALPP